MPTGLPRRARCGLLSRLRSRPPAHYRRGRSPPRLPRATTPMVRRWVAGTQKRHGGPEGRRRGCRVRGRCRPGPAVNRATSGCRVRICAGSTSRRSGPRRTNADRAPSGSASRSVLPATKQAAGAPSAWSQPSPITNERPRRWCDAGAPGRQSVTAAQKAGDEGRFRGSARSSVRDGGRS